MNLRLNRRRVADARGLTLIELVVVLAILVALVGLVLAFFPGLLRKASTSTSASSIQDVGRAVQINYTSSLTYGTGYDSLLNTGGAALFSKIAPNSAADLTIAAIPAADLTALNNLGITSYRHLDNTIPNDATFNVGGALVAIAATDNVATVTDGAVQLALRGNYTPGAGPVYYVFGLGKGASIVGANSTLQDAPVRAGENAAENPNTSYQRYGVVFLVDGATRTARFLGACAFGANGITTAEGNLQNYFTN
jgi:prepilin-type N-terminal cleavage/methylation domain-containing protein